MIRKSGYRFSERSCSTKDLERDDDLTFAIARCRAYPPSAWRRAQRALAPLPASGPWPFSAPENQVTRDGPGKGFRMNPQPNGAETVDQDEVARFSRLAGAVVGPARADGGTCTSSIRSGLPISATARPSISAAIRSASIASPGLRFLDIGCGGGILSRAAGAARRVGGRRRSFGKAISRWPGITPRSRASRSTIATRPRRRWPRPAKRSTSCSPWKWSSMSPMSACSSSSRRRW